MSLLCRSKTNLKVTRSNLLVPRKGLVRRNTHVKYQSRSTIHLRYIAGPVRTRVRLNPQHPLACRKRRLNWAVLWMRPENPLSRVTADMAR
jgi:hypothetical protein